MKAILVIDIPEDFDYRRCSMGGDGNIYYERKGEQRTSIIGNIKNLKPLPERINPLKVDGSNLLDLGYMHGRNDLINEMLGEEE